MNARNVVAALGGAVLAGQSCAASAAAGEIERPNIIVVMADDMGFSDLGCYGGEIKTPTIDRLAAEGLRFSQFYNCAVCGPSRASLMTGCYPWDAGVRSWNGKLNQRVATLLELLKTDGYETCVVGRLDNITTGNWFNPGEIAKYADRFLGTPTGGAGNYYKAQGHSPWFRDGKTWDRPEGAYSTDLISDFVADFIEGTAETETPFFIYVSHYAPHWPLQADEEDIAPYRELYQKQDRESLMKARLKRLIAEGLIPKDTTLPKEMVNAKPAAGGYLETERMAIHAAMIESIDRSLAQTMAALKNAGKLENTLILVLSDNGASAQMGRTRLQKGERPGGMNTFICQGPAVAALNNTPFRNYKTSYYEGGIASPLIAWWPRGLKDPGRLSHRLSHIADIMPTCLELAGASSPSEFNGRKVIPLAGKSFVPTLRAKETEKARERVLAWSGAARDGDWKLVVGGPALELYHLAEDRNETKNLAAGHPERVEKMKQMHARLTRAGDD